jgi:hypothetical protein
MGTAREIGRLRAGNLVDGRRCTPERRRRDTERLAQRLGQLLRALEALCRISRRAARPPGVERRRQPRRPVRRHGQRMHHDLHEQVAERLAVEGQRANEAAVGDDRQRPQVGAVIDSLGALRLLRAHVARRAEHGPGARVPGAGQRDLRLGHAEVEHLDDLVVVVTDDVDVLRLEVAVHQPRAMRLGQRARHLRDDARRLLRREAADPPQALPEVLTLEELHGDVRHALPDAVVEHGDHVRALHGRGHLGLALEARAYARVASHVLVDELQRAAGAEAGVLRVPDSAHATLTELLHQPEPAGDERPGGELEGGGHFGALLAFTMQASCAFWHEAVEAFTHSAHAPCCP